MGGRGSVELVDARGRAEAARIARRAEEEARRIERKFSRYRDGSVVSEINRSAGRTPVAVDEETDTLVASATGQLATADVTYTRPAGYTAAVTVNVRRLHDTDHSGWWLLLPLLSPVPVVGAVASIWYFVLTVLPGTPGANRFG